MNLELTRPIAFIDVQSTGLDPATARIVALAVVKVMPDGERHSRSVSVDPGVPIPAGATAVHGITNDDVAGLPAFKAYASALADHLADCDIAGFGVERFGERGVQRDEDAAGRVHAVGHEAGRGPRRRRSAFPRTS